MTEVRYSSTTTLERTQIPDTPYNKVRDVNLPDGAILFDHHSASDGGKYPAPGPRVPTGGLTITMVEKPEKIRWIKVGNRPVKQEWHRVKSIEPSELVRGLNHDMWVCLETKKGNKIGHWRGASI